MNFTNLLIEKDEHIATVFINRPKALNALDALTLSELAKVFAQLEKDDEVRVIILTGSGNKAFVAGADIACIKNFGAMEGRLDFKQSLRFWIKDC